MHWKEAVGFQSPDKLPQIVGAEMVRFVAGDDSCAFLQTFATDDSVYRQKFVPLHGGDSDQVIRRKHEFRIFSFMGICIFPGEDALNGMIDHQDEFFSLDRFQQACGIL